VLIRAVEPVPDEANRDVFAILAKNRGGVSGTNLTNGPAKLTQALGIDMSLSGHDLRSAPLKLLPGSLRPGEAIVTSPRVGISKAKDLPRRFFITPNSYVSRVPKDNLKKSK
jgi:DNA-3-methyladenine glycosylase